MLDIKFIRENKDLVIKKLLDRNFSAVKVEEVIELDKKIRKNIQILEVIKAEKNKFNNEISKLKNEEKSNKIKEMTLLTKNEEVVAEKLSNLRQSYLKIIKDLPNIPTDDVKVGKDESENEIISEFGKAKIFNFKPKDHLELGLSLDIIEIEKAVSASGTRFNYLKNEAVLLQFALINYVFSILTNEKELNKIIKQFDLKVAVNDKTVFKPIIPPVLVKEETLDRMARLEPKNERYYIPSDNLYLIGSAEHSLGPLHADEIIDVDKLPIRYIGYSNSFRREAGSYGKDTKGIFRVHQFDKLEMETFTHPDNSLAEQDFILAIQEYLMQSLDIPYRVLRMCTGDMTDPDARQIDIEAWIPSQKTYRETHTSDLTTDYQARRLNIRVKEKDGKKKILHMNDGTAFAIGRTIIAILENYQQADGSVNIPKVLQLFMGGIKKIIPKK